MTATPPQPAIFLRALASLAAVLVGAQVVRTVYQLVRWHFFSEFSRIPGPPSRSWPWGNFKEATIAKTQEWQEEYKILALSCSNLRPSTHPQRRLPSSIPSILSLCTGF
ncbi:hypothetical protein C8R46DRAFT_1105339 [Mycena filopes]|nr:hypothetical protein C8R46DRAFT_1105339 [Mycena filopes]